MSYSRLNSGHRFGGWACALALLPMLLWPSLARSACCCADLAGQAKQANSSLTDSVASSTGGAQPLQLAASDSCPRCITSSQPVSANGSPELATLASHCECQSHLLANFVSPRADSATTDYRTVSFPIVSTAISTAVDNPALALSSDVPVRLLSPTAHQRRALLCCWLN